MLKRFYEKDGNLDRLKGRTIAIIGYGSQGHAHALESARFGSGRGRRTVSGQQELAEGRSGRPESD